MDDLKVVSIKITDLKKKYAKLRVDRSLSQLSDTSQLKKTRREIAKQYTSYTKHMKLASVAAKQAKVAAHQAKVAAHQAKRAAKPSEPVSPAKNEIKNTSEGAES